jgi:hypothetical protein
MLTAISDVVGSQPILALFLAIGLGYAVGQISILGFSLGIGAVLFVGLAIGAFAPKAQIAGPIGLIGLIMFLYGIGILYGRQFFEGLSGVGRKYNLLAVVAVIAGLLVALTCGQAVRRGFFCLFVLMQYLHRRLLASNRKPSLTGHETQSVPRSSLQNQRETCRKLPGVARMDLLRRGRQRPHRTFFCHPTCASDICDKPAS